MQHIVFIHGMWSGKWTFAEYDQFFTEQGFTCHRPVLPFHHSTNLSQAEQDALGQTSILDYVSFLESYINKLDSKPILIGHSMGGLLAQLLAAKGLAEKAVLICPASPSSIHGLTLSVVISFIGIMSKWGFWRTANKMSFNTAKFALLNKIPAKQQQEFYDLLGYESGRAAFEIGFWLIDNNKATALENKIDCPLLMISGQQDHITPASVHKKIAELYPQIEHKIYPDHAHWIMAEPGWQQVAQDIADWLRK